MVVRMTSDLETYVVSVERIKEYSDCPKEVDTSRSSFLVALLGFRFCHVLRSIDSHLFPVRNGGLAEVNSVPVLTCS